MTTSSSVLLFQATQAYLSGNKALAKQLSEEGHRHSAQMKELHEAASEAIFRSRNGNLPAAVAKHSSVVLDFHGLHASEAVRILDRELERMASSKRSEQLLTVRLIVGTGHHTKVGTCYCASIY